MTCNFKLAMTMALIAFQLSACSSGGGSESAGLPQEMSSQTISSGTITDFGSIFVNGIEFELNDAEITINDNNGTENQLQLGMQVIVEAEVNDDRTTGNASSVRYDLDIEGPISAITSNDGDKALVVILGANVSIDDRTVLDNFSLDTIAVDQVVEVSGFRKRDNSIQATRIEKKSDVYASGSKLEIEGHILSLNREQKQFVIGEATIDYSDADFTNLTADSIILTMFVEVKGSEFGDNNELFAKSIEREDDAPPLDDHSSLEVEGVITHFTSLNNFTVASVLVNGKHASIVNGSSADLAIDVKVEVEGIIESEELQAIRISIK